MLLRAHIISNQCYKTYDKTPNCYRFCNLFYCAFVSKHFTKNFPTLYNNSIFVCLCVKAIPKMRLIGVWGDPPPGRAKIRGKSAGIALSPWFHWTIQLFWIILFCLITYWFYYIILIICINTYIITVHHTFTFCSPVHGTFHEHNKNVHDLFPLCSTWSVHVLFSPPDRDLYATPPTHKGYVTIRQQLHRGNSTVA